MRAETIDTLIRRSAAICCRSSTGSSTAGKLGDLIEQALPAVWIVLFADVKRRSEMQCEGSKRTSHASQIVTCKGPITQLMQADFKAADLGKPSKFALREAEPGALKS